MSIWYDVAKRPDAEHPGQFGINVIETGAALALLEQTNAGTAMKSSWLENLIQD